jgi:hypothetical protein
MNEPRNLVALTGSLLQANVSKLVAVIELAV